MSKLITQKCSVCSASLLNTQKWSTPKTNSLRSITTKRTSNRLNVEQGNCSKGTIDNLEDEYIKQLQQQIYYLETECQYLRDQLNKNSTLINLSKQTEQEHSELQRSLVEKSSQYKQLSSENHGLTIALNNLRQKFDSEKQNIVDELTCLKQTRDTLEQQVYLRDQEIRQNRDTTRLLSDELKNIQTKLSVLEQQFEQQLNENKLLNGELHYSKLESTNLQRSLDNYQTISQEKDRLQNLVIQLENHIKTLQQQSNIHHTQYKETQLLHNKLIDEKNTLIKEITRLETLAIEFERELEELRLTLRDRNDELQIKDKEILDLKKKEDSFRSKIDNMQINLETQVIKNQDLDEKIKYLQRQLNIEIENRLIAKRENQEYEIRCVQLQDEIHNLQHDKDHLTIHRNTLKQQLINQEIVTNQLKIEIQQFENRVKEIDRLKLLEDLIQSQRWDDISQMAQTMQSVSQTMARATSPIITQKNRLQLQ